MLEEIKSQFSAQAQFIPGWGSKSKTELCNLYIQNEDDESEKNHYFSAIILKYWDKIFSLHAKTYLTASYEDVYNWLVDSIIYALKNRKWLNPKSRIYNDPDGPDKVINRRIKCLRINHLISSNRYKRQAHINLLSLDSLADPDNLVYYTNEYNDTVLSAISKYWNNGEYIKSVLLDLLSQGDCTTYSDQDVEESVILGQISDYICSLLESDKYCDYFSEKYGVLNVRDGLESKLMDVVGDDLWGYGEYKVYKPQKVLSAVIKKSLEQLKEDRELKESLK